jgi:hypothetical protein
MTRLRSTRRQFAFLIRCQTRPRAATVKVLQSFRTPGVEPVHPIAQRLAIHAADPGRLSTVHPIEHGLQRQQPPALARIRAVLGPLVKFGR